MLPPIGMCIGTGLPPKFGNVVQAMLDSGQLTITAGRIQDYQAASDVVAVTVRQRQAKTNWVLQVSRVVNCTGVEVDYRRSPQSLIANLRTQGLIRPNDIGLGLDTAADSAVFDAQGNRSTLLYTLGSST